MLSFARSFRLKLFGVLTLRGGSLCAFRLVLGRSQGVVKGVHVLTTLSVSKGIDAASSVCELRLACGESDCLLATGATMGLTYRAPHAAGSSGVTTSASVCSKQWNSKATQNCNSCFWRALG